MAACTTKQGNIDPPQIKRLLEVDPHLAEYKEELARRYVHFVLCTLPTVYHSAFEFVLVWKFA